VVVASNSGVARSIPIAESVPLPNGYPGPSALANVLSLAGVAQSQQRPIRIPALGLTLVVRLSPDVFGGAASVIETVHAPGFGPPLHRHPETEVFRVLRGRYVMQMDDELIELAEGDVVTVPGGVAHAFVNVSEEDASQWVLITPGMQADVFFGELSQLMRKGPPERAALDAFGRKWGVEFLGPPLRADVVGALF
jgi:quercetin dioxygenase-like cupin family protein